MENLIPIQKEIIFLVQADFTAYAFPIQEQSFLLKASIWAGNEFTYNYLSDVLGFQLLNHKSDSENVPVLFNAKTDYSEEFINRLFEKGPLSSRDSIIKAIQDNLEYFTFHGCPKFDTLNQLFKKPGNGKISPSFFQSPLPSS